MEKEIYRFKRTASDDLVVSLRNYKGADYFDIRVFFTGLDGKSHASKKGVTLSIAHINELAKGIDLTLKELEKIGGVK
jgi:hypothetical protein